MFFISNVLLVFLIRPNLSGILSTTSSVDVTKLMPPPVSRPLFYFLKINCLVHLVVVVVAVCGGLLNHCMLLRRLSFNVLCVHLGSQLSRFCVR